MDYYVEIKYKPDDMKYPGRPWSLEPGNLPDKKIDGKRFIVKLELVDDDLENTVS